jgi:phenol hydroxylase P1 protein
MSIEIPSRTIEPIRLTYDHVARRIGEGKPGSRYQEATYDLQSTVNFHYRPLWDPKYEVYDVSRTAIVMEDWYSFKDPRQFYYGTYTMARAKQQEIVEKNFEFVDKRNLFADQSDEIRNKINSFIVPLRHVEWGANMNNCAITDFGYGVAVTQVTMFNSIDRLGIAQYLTRIGLMANGNDTAVLDQAKSDWLGLEMWQKLRHAMEDIFVLEDWFETMIAQNIVMDGLVYPLIYQRLVDDLSQDNIGVAMLTEFMNDWYAETVRWTNALIKTTAAESVENTQLLSNWTSQWLARLSESLEPICLAAFPETGLQYLTQIRQELFERMCDQGLVLKGNDHGR